MMLQARASLSPVTAGVLLIGNSSMLTQELFQSRLGETENKCCISNCAYCLSNRLQLTNAAKKWCAETRLFTRNRIGQLERIQKEKL